MMNIDKTMDDCWLAFSVSGRSVNIEQDSLRVMLAMSTQMKRDLQRCLSGGMAQATSLDKLEINNIHTRG